MSGSAWRSIAGSAALLAGTAAAAWFAWHSAYADHWRWRRAREVEHEQAEAIFRSIELPSWEEDAPSPGALVVAVGDEITLDESGWALVHDAAAASDAHTAWLYRFPLDGGDPLSATVSGLEEELRAFAERQHLRGDERVIEVHADRAVPFGVVRRVLYTAFVGDWAPAFRVANPGHVGALPHSWPLPPEPDGPEIGAYIVHLRADGMFLDEWSGTGRRAHPAGGEDRPKVGGAQDLAALEAFAAQRAPAPPISPGKPVILNTDDDVPYGEMMAAYELLRGHGYTVNLAGGPPGSSVDRRPEVEEDRSFLPTSTTGDPIIVGSLTRAEIDRVVEGRMPELRYCYARELSRQPELAGKVTVKFVVGRDGAVTKAATKSSTLKSPAVEACLEGRFLRMTFPAPTGGGIAIVAYPLSFQRD